MVLQLRTKSSKDFLRKHLMPGMFPKIALETKLRHSALKHSLRTPLDSLLIQLIHQRYVSTLIMCARSQDINKSKGLKNKFADVSVIHDTSARNA